jgi:thiol:disulfide interchange protein
MAACDYRSCDVCGGKVFYDANLNYDHDDAGNITLDYLGDWCVICTECAKTHESKVVKKEPTP